MLDHTSEFCLDVGILQDSVPEVQEELKLYLLTTSRGYIIRSVVATLVIRDDDGESSLCLFVFLGFLALWW